jgi:hypothetical protein
MTDFPGSGIGLATVQRVIHRHNGHVWFESACGQGATFFFTIGDPLARRELDVLNKMEPADAAGKVLPEPPTSAPLPAKPSLSRATGAGA